MSGVRFLTPRQLRGLHKVGDVLIPGDAHGPSFTDARCAAAADRVLMFMEQADRDRVRRALGLARMLPRVVLRPLLAFAARPVRCPAPVAAGLRALDLVLRSVVMTLYYSDVGDGASVHAALGWHPRIVDRKTEPSAVVPVAARPRPERPRSMSPAVRAAEQARAGARSLARLTLDERAAVVGALRRAVLDRRESIIDHIQADTGNTRSDALLSEIFAVLDVLLWLEQEGVDHLRDQRASAPTVSTRRQSWVWYEPRGTILVIAPCVRPFYQAVVPIASAFLAGNTVIHKPSEWTPLEGLVESLLATAGFAPHWAQIVYGDDKVGAALVEQRPDMILFTGSTHAGRKVLAQAAQALVPVTLGLSGNDPMIVFDDVDLRRAVAGVVWGALTTAGQSCTSIERVYVQAPIYEAFKAALVRAVERLKQEIDSDGDADIGVMTTDAQVRRVSDHIADAQAKGAVVLTGDDWNGVSRLVPPMVVDGVTDDMRLVREETCGPVIPLLRFATEDEVVRRANDGEYGLTASVWSGDLARAERVARRLDCGGVSINDVAATAAHPALPFGGRKQSGVGRVGGAYGLRELCNVKAVSIDKDSARIEAAWYPHTREKYRLLNDVATLLFGDGQRTGRGLARVRRKLDRHARRVRRGDER